jgi:hypothetical protein
MYTYAPHNDVSVKDDSGPIKLYYYDVLWCYNNYPFVTISYSIQYSNVQYKFVDWEQ